MLNRQCTWNNLDEIFNYEKGICHLKTNFSIVIFRVNKKFRNIFGTAFFMQLFDFLAKPNVNHHMFNWFIKKGF